MTYEVKRVIAQNFIVTADNALTPQQQIECIENLGTFNESPGTASPLDPEPPAYFDGKTGAKL